MSDLYNSFLQSSWFIAPFFAFLIGAAGSLHCAGMCGGLALAVSRDKRDPLLYNFGRLGGYLLLVSLFALFGAFLMDPEIKRVFALIGGVFVGVMLMLAGIQYWKGGELSLQLPLVGKFYNKIFKKLAVKRGSIRPFGLGASSILLPCALSNGFILAALSLSGAWWAVVLTVFFWAGTLPAMVLGPKFLVSVNKRYGIKAQRAIGIVFIFAGVAALGVKITHAWDIGLLCFS